MQSWRKLGILILKILNYYIEKNGNNWNYKHCLSHVLRKILFEGLILDIRISNQMKLDKIIIILYDIFCNQRRSCFQVTFEIVMKIDPVSLAFARSISAYSSLQHIILKDACKL